jgi:hypothetical protein
MIRTSGQSSRIVVAVLVAGMLAGCGPKTTECRDGTHSTSTGRGTCSGHGGIKEAA